MQRTASIYQSKVSIRFALRNRADSTGGRGPVMEASVYPAKVLGLYPVGNGSQGQEALWSDHHLELLF